MSSRLVIWLPHETPADDFERVRAALFAHFRREWTPRGPTLPAFDEVRVERASAVPPATPEYWPFTRNDNDREAARNRDPRLRPQVQANMGRDSRTAERDALAMVTEILAAGQKP